ncbi:MFS general substrate transporter [Cantharellus anzutake]|uniref:MFS general substrate transporter n=1 Tax=Cantharellus anzutake TaxID=1750568 RepID=UPI001908B329|nr:MFS general substrate transporter [Cantharellus anzutake]KAF8324457.1 MFS general substrate transporter [Cantharellus anzutake]
MAFKATSLPWAQLLILAVVRLAEPIGYSQIFPYVNEMMERLHVTDDPANIGYYSGLVESSFSLAQLLTIYQWSKLSDRIGRKPVIIMGLAGVALSSFCFGLSTSFMGALVSRSLSGMLCGNIAVLWSMLSEITDSTNQGTVFPLFGAVWAMGTVIGPMIGGDLSDPAERYPDTFGKYQFLRDYPYFLPCALSSCITLGSIILCFLFVNETLPKIVEAREAQRNSTPPNASNPGYGSIIGNTTPAVPRSSNIDHSVVINPDSSTGVQESSNSGNEEVSMSLWEVLYYPKVPSMLISTSMLSFLAVGFDVMFVLFSYTGIDLGGLGRSPQQIGLALSASGLLGAFGSVLVFPWLQRTFNNRKMFSFLMAMWILAYLFAPIASIIVRLSHNNATVSWLGVVLILVPARIGLLCLPLSMIIVKASAPSKELLGTTFGLQQTTNSFARAVSPAFVSSLYAISIDHREILNGNVEWLIMVLISIYGVFISSRVRDVEPATPKAGDSHGNVSNGLDGEVEA